MQIGIYGSGYLGTVISACLADFGTPVTCYDEDASSIQSIADGNVPFYERNLKDILRRNIRAGRLNYSTDMESFAKRADLIFLASDSHKYIEELSVRLGKYTKPDSVLVIMTPVPVGLSTRVEHALAASGSKMIVVSQPMFFTDGCAVEDFNWPDRIILGTTSSDAVLKLKQIYRPLVMRGVPVIVTNHETAELVREATTAFVATKISFINELASLCEHVKADAMDLAMALGLDKKIAPRCLQPGTTLGGAFAEGDIDSLAQLAQGSGVSLEILSAARKVQRSLSDRLVEKISRMVQPIGGRQVGILGLSFKPHTNSVAASSSIQLARQLLAKGARVRAYDPVAMPDAKIELNGTVSYCNDPYAAAEGVDALVVSTGWPEFRALDFDRIKRTVKQPIIFDTKNLLDGSRLRAMGFQYVGLGRVN
jgi:UDPglucose 6-dehydrogenase